MLLHCKNTNLHYANPWISLTTRAQSPLYRMMRLKRDLILLVLISSCVGHKKKSAEDAWKHIDKTNGKSCANLTQVLDNWKYAIMHQVKDLIVNDHISVLPDYGRIRPLSDAVDDLYNQFNTLKHSLAKLTMKFEEVEDFVDELQAGKIPKTRVWQTPRHPAIRMPTQIPLRASGRGNWVRRARARRIPGT